MRTVLTIVPLLFAMNCLAVPALEERRDCAPFTNTTFTILALPDDANRTAVPIVLGKTNITTNIAFLSSEPSENARSFILYGGALLARDNNQVKAVSIPAHSGAKVAFNVTSELPTVGQKFCADGVSLAVNGDTTGFSLCRSDTAEAWDVQNVVYRASADDDREGGYCNDTCYGVTLRLLFR